MAGNRAVTAVEPMIVIVDKVMHVHIEDTLLITADGAQSLTVGLPRQVDELLAVVGSGTPAEVPWLSVNPDAGATAAGETTPVDVTFDATAAPIGTYEALLCVFSNDPDEPLVEVPATMEVVIPVELLAISVE